MSKSYKIAKGPVQSLNYAIRVFDKLEPDGSLKTFDTIRKIKIPYLLGKYLKMGRITEDIHNSLLVQLNSPDREAWYLAFILIKQLKPPK